MPVIFLDENVINFFWPKCQMFSLDKNITKLSLLNQNVTNFSLYLNASNYLFDVNITNFLLDLNINMFLLN